MLGDGFHRGPLWRQTMRLVRGCFAVASAFPADEKSGLAAAVKRAATALPGKVATAYAHRDDDAFIKALETLDAALMDLDAHLAIAQMLQMAPPRRLRKLRKACVAVSQLIAYEQAGVRNEPTPLKLAS